MRESLRGEDGTEGIREWPTPALHGALLAQHRPSFRSLGSSLRPSALRDSIPAEHLALPPIETGTQRPQLQNSERRHAPHGDVRKKSASKPEFLD